MRATLFRDGDGCPLCKNPADLGEQNNGVNEVRCDSCGTFDIGTMAASHLQEPDARLCAWVRQHHDLGERLCFRNDDIKKLQAQLSAPGVLEKQQLLLRWIEKKTAFPGDFVEISPETDWPVAWCSNRNELKFHYAELIKQGLVEESDPDTRTYADGDRVRISTIGWQKLILSNDRVEPDLIFVAMWFDATMNDAWENGFKKGINEAGYRAHRVDQQPHVERIDMKLLADIRRSRIIVADATGVRPNVYYEAGYAEALGRPVIWTVREDYKDKKQFDTRQFRHVIWQDPNDLAKQLEEFIGGIAGRRKASNG
jgi:hypothetical protein